MRQKCKQRFIRAFCSRNKVSFMYWNNISLVNAFPLYFQIYRDYGIGLKADITENTWIINTIMLI